MKLSRNKKEDFEVEDNNVKKSHWKRNIFLILLILIIGAVYFVYSYAQKPAEGVIIKNSESVKRDALANQNVPEIFQGKYFTFLYSKEYVLKSHDTDEKDGAVILEQAFLSQAAATSKKIAVTVRNLPTHNLDDAPDFKMRVLKSEVYKKENFQLGEIGGVCFSPAEVGQFEKSFFILRGNLLTIVAISAAGSSEDADLAREADSIVKSISWLK